MFIAYVVVAVLLALVLIASAAGKLTRNPGATAGLVTVGAPSTLWPWMAAAEIAGGLGLIVGIWVGAIGVAAAIGIIVYFVLAVGSHLRVKDKGFVPAAVIGLVGVAALALRLVSF